MKKHHRETEQETASCPDKSYIRTVLGRGSPETVRGLYRETVVSDQPASLSTVLERGR